MDRTPPITVRRALRQEVGFGCPAGPSAEDTCGSPYLTWHHFDPPWHVNQHHNPEGMVALCREHHDKAEGSAYTADQLREFKSRSAGAVSGRFDWMRRQLLVVVGGNFYLDTPIPVQLGDQPLVELKRDDEGYLLVSMTMPGPSPRLRMEDNFWLSTGTPADLECPPFGKRIRAHYEDGDEVRIEFFELDAADDLRSRYAGFNYADEIPYPITAVEVQMKLAAIGIDFGARRTQLGTNQIINGFMRGCRVGIQIGAPPLAPPLAEPTKRRPPLPPRKQRAIKQKQRERKRRR
jgi:hypothetical protein